MDKRVLQQISEKEWYYGNLSEDGKAQSGIGLKRERDGSLYYGLWEDGLRAGFGVLCGADGSLTAGTWENDKAAEVQLKVYPTGDALAVFNGTFDKGKPKEGTLLCSDGKLYHGIFTEWQKENFNGEGALLWPDKRIYAGSWQRGGPTVGGVIRRADGKVTGTLSNVRKGYTAKSWQEEAEKHFFYGKTEDEEVRNSDGILFYAAGEFFSGQMRGGQRTGFGIYRSPDEMFYIGEWDNAGMQGQGMCVRCTPETIEFYTGSFRNSLYEGEGCSMRRVRGEWDFLYNGAWKAGKKSGEGLLNLNGGKLYVGGFREDQRDGEGETIDSDGSRSTMNWEMGVPIVLLEQADGPGPMRYQYGEQEKISQAVLNSLKDGDEFGEEQYFVGIRADADTAYQRTMRIEPGCDYEVRVFYHNDANVETVGDEGTARETKLRVFFTKEINAGKIGVISASITSDGSLVPAIWDGIAIQSTEQLTLSYKMASAKLYNSSKRDGRILPQTLFTEAGVYLGIDELNGILPPESSGYVTFLLHTSGERKGNSMSFRQRVSPAVSSAAQRPVAEGTSHNTAINEQGKRRRRSRVSVSIMAAVGNGEYEKVVSADIGEEFHVKIAFTNSASDQDIKIAVVLPPAVEFMSGSSVLELSDGLRRKQSDQWIYDGLVLSNFFAEGEGEIQFRLRYFPDGTPFTDSLRVTATIETADITMKSELQITER